MTPGDLDTMFRQLKKVVLEKALGAELTHHLGYEKGAPRAGASGNPPPQVAEIVGSAIAVLAYSENRGYRYRRRLQPNEHS